MLTTRGREWEKTSRSKGQGMNGLLKYFAQLCCETLNRALLPLKYVFTLGDLPLLIALNNVSSAGCPRGKLGSLSLSPLSFHLTIPISISVPEQKLNKTITHEESLRRPEALSNQGSFLCEAEGLVDELHAGGPYTTELRESLQPHSCPY